MTQRSRWHHAAIPVSFFSQFALFALIALGGAAPIGYTQTAPKTPDSAQGQPNPNANPQSITIDVTVTDKSGEHIRGLSAGDFTLLDNKQPIKLTGFRALDTKASPPDPVQIVIVVDMINTGFTAVARERVELEQFLKQDGGRLAHPTSIAILAESGIKVEQGSTSDGNALLAILNKQGSELRTVGRNTGFYGAAERLEMSLNQLGQLAGFEAKQPGRKLLLFISPGWPMLTRSGDESDLKQRTWVFNTLVRLSNGLRDGHITLYTLDPFDLGRTDPFYYQAFLKPVAAIKNAEYPNLSLQVLSEHSGGKVLIQGRDITGELNEAVRDANASYELTFAAAPGDRPDEYHALQVLADKPGAVVRTSAGYYAHTMER
jgi:VWFA-related protein